MPRGDGTGPMGEGPMTGRGAGLCAGNVQPGFAGGQAGRGFGPGFGGRGFAGDRRFAGGGRGYRNRVYPTQGGAGFAAQPMAADPAVQRQGLEQQAGLLKSQLAFIEKRLAELAAGDSQC